MIGILLLGMLLVAGLKSGPIPDIECSAGEIFIVLGLCALPIGVNIMLLCLGMLDEDGYHSWKNRRKP